MEERFVASALADNAKGLVGRQTLLFADDICDREYELVRFDPGLTWLGRVNGLVPKDILLIPIEAVCLNDGQLQITRCTDKACREIRAKLVE
jgi:hypothetical protein